MLIKPRTLLNTFGNVVASRCQELSGFEEVKTCVIANMPFDKIISVRVML